MNESKKTVLITGASSGIGYEISKIFAKNGFNIILVSRNKVKLESIGRNIKNKYNIEVDVIDVDLGNENSAEIVYKRVKEKKRNVNILINNAGVGYAESFCKTCVEKDFEIIDVNIKSLINLTKFFSKDMIEHGEGSILNVASTGAYQPGPYTASYYASKSYVLSFSEALRVELSEYNINVSVLCPGATKTNFSKNAGKEDVKGAMSPQKVAFSAYNGLKKNKAVIIPGLVNKICIVFSKILPGLITARIVKSIQKSVIKKN